MVRKKLILLTGVNMKYLHILLFVLISGTSVAQTFGTCPLDSGNVWVYDNFAAYKFWSLLDTTVIFNDTLKYQILQGNYLGQLSEVNVRLRDDNYFVQRMPDSYNTPNHERIYYKIGAKIGDSWIQPDPGGITDSLLTEVVDTFRTSVFNKVVTLRSLHIHYSLIDYYETWSDDFGLMSVEDYMGTVYYLYGCIIDGTAYGDTTVLGVDEIPESPDKFILEQNFPNPFNPATTINYQLPQAGFVTLKVYDVLGREVAVLVTEEKPAGRYTVNFEAPDLASGIYIYQLRVNDYVSSKKMLLLK